MDANMMTAIANAVLTTLTDEQLKSEIIRRGLVSDDPIKAIENLTLMVRVDKLDLANPVIGKFIAELPTPLVLDQVDLDDALDYYDRDTVLGEFDSEALFEYIGDEYKNELVRSYLEENGDVAMEIIEEADTDTLLGVIRGRCRS